MGTQPPQDKVGSLRDRLREGDSANKAKRFSKPYAERYSEAMVARLERSLTRKFLNGFFFVAYVAVGLDFLLRTVEKQSLIAMIWWLPYAFTAPLQLLWKPDPHTIMVGPLRIYLIGLVTLALCAALHVSLLAMHKAVVAGRLYVPK